MFHRSKQKNRSGYSFSTDTNYAWLKNSSTRSKLEFISWQVDFIDDALFRNSSDNKTSAENTNTLDVDTLALTYRMIVLIETAPYILPELNEAWPLLSEITADNVIDKICESLNKKFELALTPAYFKSTYDHVAKIGHRYNLDTEHSFLFWVLSNIIKHQLGYGADDKEKQSIADVKESITWKLLQNILFSKDLRRLNIKYDRKKLESAFLAKLNRSCSKSLARQQMNGFFAANDYSNSLIKVIDENHKRLDVYHRENWPVNHRVTRRRRV